MNAPSDTPSAPAILRPMCCDQWDFDLLQVLPHLPRHLGHSANAILYTYGSTWRDPDDPNAQETLQSPAVWNDHTGFVALFGFERVGFKPAHYHVGGETLVACTFLEALRVCYGKGYNLYLNNRPLWNTAELRGPHQTLLGHVRDWKKLDGSPAFDQAAVDEARRAVETAAIDVILRFNHLLERFDHEILTPKDLT